jgi:hypothetical protein
MDDKSTELLSQLLAAQKEQTELLRRYLWRFRFSLLSLLLLTTATAVGLGVLAYQNHRKTAAIPMPASTAASATWSVYPSSGGTLRLYSAPQPGTTPSLNVDLGKSK